MRPPPATALTASTMRSRSSCGQRRVHRAARAPRGGPLGLGQVQARGVAAQRLQPVVGDRVVDARADPSSSRSAAHHLVAVLGDPDRVLVVDVRRASATGGHDDALRGARRGTRRCAAASPVQPADLGQLDPADGGVDVGHPVVEADDLVGVLPLHALVAQQPDPAGESRRRRRRPCRPRRTSCSWSGRGENIANVPKRADRARRPGRAVRLRGVLEEHQAVLARRSAASSVMSAGWPKRCTGMIALVRAVIAASTACRVEAEVRRARCRRTPAWRR